MNGIDSGAFSVRVIEGFEFDDTGYIGVGGPSGQPTQSSAREMHTARDGQRSMNHDLERRLREAEARFQTLVEEMPAIIYINAWDDPHPMLYVSPHVEEMLGYPAEDWIEQSGFVYKIIHPDDRAALHNENERTEAIGARLSMEYRLLARDGHVVWVRDECVPVYDTDGYPLFYQGIMINVSDRRRAEEALRESEAFFRSTFDNAGIAMGVADLDFRLLRVNQPHCEMLGYSEAELLATTPSQLMHPDCWSSHQRWRADLLTGRSATRQVERRYVHKDGRIVWGLVNLSLVQGGDGEPRYFLSQIQDITDRKHLEARLTHQAFHDSLTGLPNRALLHDRISHALERARRNDETIAVMFMDLDGFKAVNDTHGHAIGDQLLVRIGQRLRGWVRAGDTVARLGGDEFTILLEDIGTLEEATQIAARVITGLEEPIALADRDLQVRASLGIAYNHPTNLPPDELLRNADLALYRAKRAGGSQYAVYAEGIHPHITTGELRATYP